MRVLIITKRGQGSGGSYGSGTQSGLYYSCLYVAEMLQDTALATARLVTVVDNNDIDREVSRFQPDVVIIEALWVVPEKFHVLRKLHPTVKWIVRVHSELPFLAQEGVATDWISQYVEQGVVCGDLYVAFNSERTADDYADRYSRSVARAERILWLPNYYPPVEASLFGRRRTHYPGRLWVGCFGAIRPMKNHLTQAIAAITLATERGDHLRFMVNATRVETGGETSLKNLRGLFNDAKRDGHELLEMPWVTRSEFAEMCSRVDLGMQCSLSESYNLVAANLIGAGTPVVTSHQVRFVHPMFQAEATDVGDIVAKAKRALRWGFLPANARRLNATSRRAVREWRAVLARLAR